MPTRVSLQTATNRFGNSQIQPYVNKAIRSESTSVNLDPINAEIDALQADVSTLQTDVSTLQTEVLDLQTDVVDLQNDKVSKAGDTMSGNLDLNNNALLNAGTVSINSNTISSTDVLEFVSGGTGRINFKSDSGILSLENANLGNSVNVELAQFGGTNFNLIKQTGTVDFCAEGTDNIEMTTDCFGTNKKVILDPTAGTTQLRDYNLDMNSNDITNVNSTTSGEINCLTLNTTEMKTNRLFCTAILDMTNNNINNVDLLDVDRLQSSTGTIQSQSNLDLQTNDLLNVRSITATGTKFIYDASQFGSINGDFYELDNDTVYVVMGNITSQYGIRFGSNNSIRGVDFGSTLTFDESVRDCQFEAIDQNFYISNLTIVGGGGKFSETDYGLINFEDFNTGAPAPFYGRNRRCKITNVNFIKPYSYGKIQGGGTINWTNNFMNGGGGANFYTATFTNQYTQGSIYTTSGGTGTGLQVKVVRTTTGALGVITVLQIEARGFNYTNGDVITILGGTPLNDTITLTSITPTGKVGNYTEYGLKISDGLSCEFINNKYVLNIGAQYANSTMKLIDLVGATLSPVQLGFNAAVFGNNILHPRALETAINFDVDSRTALGTISGNTFIRQGGTGPLLDYPDQSTYNNYNRLCIENYTIDTNAGITNSEPNCKGALGTSIGSTAVNPTRDELEPLDNTSIIDFNSSNRFGVQINLTGVTSAFIADERITDVDSGATALIIAVEPESGGNQTVYLTDFSATFSPTGTSFTSPTGSSGVGTLTFRYRYCEKDPRKLVVVGTFTVSTGNNEQYFIAPGNGTTADALCEVSGIANNSGVGGTVSLNCSRTYNEGDILNFYISSAGGSNTSLDLGIINVK